MHLTQLIVPTLALAGAALAAPQKRPYKPEQPEQPTCPTLGPGSGLSDAMRARGREFIGTAITLRDEPREAEIVDAEYNAMTPENAMKWESIQPSRGNFTFDSADAHVAFAAEHDLQIQCHTLVWHSQLPAWVSEGGFDNATLIDIMYKHIETLAGRYRDVCTRWDVVNEALNENGTYRSSVWYDTIGEAYLPIAFRFAAEISPGSKLYYNDYNLEYNQNKTDGALRILKLIQSYGVRIDGVGFQGHVASEPTDTSPGAAPDQATLEAALAKMTAEDVDVAYTEIDVRMNTPPSAAQLREQATVWERMARACLSNARCVGMTTWGISDRYSWIPETFEGEGAALLWGINYLKKPAYYGFLRGILNWW
ncbi:hypothetical protein MBLNU230_g7682t1 [Neophaeotheca triangularis]